MHNMGIKNKKNMQWRLTRMGVDAYLGHEQAMRYHKNGVNVHSKANNISHALQNRN